MDLETELEEFRALSLILQHRALGRELDAIAGIIESCQSAGTSDHETAQLLLPVLRRFTQALPEHFAAESRSTASLLRDDADTEFARRLRQLDGEHADLLARFQLVSAQLTRHGTRAADVPLPRPLEQVMADLLLAIATFRRHESDEDALFVA